MARVFIDVNIFSEKWFGEILPELMARKSVRFTYGKSKKLEKEFALSRKAAEFYKIVSQLKDENNNSRLIVSDLGSIESEQIKIEKMKFYKECESCDDAHIFALIYHKPTQYIFSMDARMAKCRDYLNKFIDKRYCDFKVISAKKIYIEHKDNILN